MRSSPAYGIAQGFVLERLTALVGSGEFTGTLFHHPNGGILWTPIVSGDMHRQSVERPGSFCCLGRADGTVEPHHLLVPLLKHAGVIPGVGRWIDLTTVSSYQSPLSPVEASVPDLTSLMNNPERITDMTVIAAPVPAPTPEPISAPIPATGPAPASLAPAAAADPAYDLLMTVKRRAAATLATAYGSRQIDKALQAIVVGYEELATAELLGELAIANLKTAIEDREDQLLSDIPAGGTVDSRKGIYRQLIVADEAMIALKADLKNAGHELATIKARRKAIKFQMRSLEARAALVTQELAILAGA